MQLLIQQRVFTWGDKYDVYDERGDVRYYVESEFFTIGHQIHVYDQRSGQEVGSIHQRLLTFTPEFDIVIRGRTVGTIRKRLTLFTPSYEVDFMGWDVEGDFLEWDYQVLQGSHSVMDISKCWLSWGDTYALTYQNIDDEIPGLLLVIAIDAANCDRK